MESEEKGVKEKIGTYEFEVVRVSTVKSPPPHKPPPLEETLDGKPPHYKPPPKHKPPTPLDKEEKPIPGQKPPSLFEKPPKGKGEKPPPEHKPPKEHFPGHPPLEDAKDSYESAAEKKPLPPTKKPPVPPYKPPHKPPSTN
ncbi:hypothetical protein ACJW31_02G082100 [Castanea mollissima]